MSTLKVVYYAAVGGLVCSGSAMIGYGLSMMFKKKRSDDEIQRAAIRADDARNAAFAFGCIGILGGALVGICARPKCSIALHPDDPSGYRH